MYVLTTYLQHCKYSVCTESCSERLACKGLNHNRWGWLGDRHWIVWLPWLPKDRAPVAQSPVPVCVRFAATNQDAYS